MREVMMSENTMPAAVMAQSVPAVRAPADTGTTFAILVSLSVCHMLNDLNQSLVPALYPILKTSYQLDFAQIGLITLSFQLTASMLQPVVGMVTDRRPQPYSLPIATGCSLIGLLMLSVANSYPLILLSAALVGIGSSVFHPVSYTHLSRFSTRSRAAAAIAWAWGLAA